MKKILLCAGALVMASSCAWSLGWGVLSWPTYKNTAKAACSKFDPARNGTLEYVYSMQPQANGTSMEHPMFSAQLPTWDAGSNISTERGALEILWHRTLEPEPNAGWPATHHKPTLEELEAMYGPMPD